MSEEDKWMFTSSSELFTQSISISMYNRTFATGCSLTFNCRIFISKVEGCETSLYPTDWNRKFPEVDHYTTIDDLVLKIHLNMQLISQNNIKVCIDIFVVNKNAYKALQDLRHIHNGSK